MGKELVKAISEIQEDEALRLVEEAVEKGADLEGILTDCQAAMNIVGSRYEKGDYFLPELIMSGEMLKKISDIVKPKLGAGAGAKGVAKKGIVVLGTVKGDIHDIGKNIVGFMLDVNGFDVRDLGVDVAPQKFVEAIREFHPQVIGLSGFLTLAFDAMKETIEAVKAAGLREGVKIMIGGGQITEQIKEYAGADAYGRDAMAGVSLAKKWLRGK